MNETVLAPSDSGPRLATVALGTRLVSDPHSDPRSDRTGIHPGRVVVGVDGSAASMSALREAIRIASALGATVQAIACWQYLIGPVGLVTVYSPEDDAHALLGDAAKAMFGDSIPSWFSSVAIEGRASDVLIERSRNSDMLVVGSRGHGTLETLFLGSVSAMCADHARCPVLIVR